jgi:hypothetical protein
MLYATLASFVNSTHITATREWLSVRHGPLPLKDGLRLASADIRQLYCVEKPGKSPSYEVRVLMEDGRRRQLIGPRASLDQVLFVEQEIERHLGIRDMVIANEALPLESGR